MLHVASLWLVVWIVADGDQPSPATRSADTPSVLTSSRCAEASAWTDVSDDAKRSELVRRLFNCFWTRTDELESDEERVALERDRLRARQPRPKADSRHADDRPADGPLKALEDQLSAMAAELSDMARQRQELIDQHATLLLPLQLEELDEHLADIQQKIESVEQARAAMNVVRGKAAAERDAREAARLSAHLALFERELQRLRGKRRDYTKDRFAVRAALGIGEVEK